MDVVVVVAIYSDCIITVVFSSTVGLNDKLVSLPKLILYSPNPHMGLSYSVRIGHCYF